MLVHILSVCDYLSDVTLFFFFLCLLLEMGRQKIIEGDMADGLTNFL